jgi:hypothetical protein
MLAPRPPRWIAAVALVVLLVVAGTVPATAARTPPAPGGAELVLTRAKSPARTVVSDGSGAWVATFTDGSRTVPLAGPTRSLTEPDVLARVDSSTWVRLLPVPFAGTVDRAWLDAARRDRSPDVLATALEYVAGAPTVMGADGLVRSSDASYGPLRADGSREEGSDWNDYQGVTATYGSVVDRPEVRQLGSLECSGFLRMLFGVRHDVPMSLEVDGARLPRRAFQMLAGAPGIVVVPDRGTQVTDLRRLQPGDLVFFDAATDDGTEVDHVGLYLGVDDGGRHRFVSSRKSIDGPTMGDHRGRSVLDGTGLYASSFRAVRRL